MQPNLKQDYGGDQLGKAIFNVKNVTAGTCEMAFNTKINDV